MSQFSLDVKWTDRKRTLFGLPLSFTKYTLTEERFFIEKGFFNSTEDEVRLYRIQDVQLKRTLGQKLFGLGSIEVHSSDQSMRDFVIKNIKHSKYVKELLSEYVEVQRDAKRVANREILLESDVDFEMRD